MLKCYDNENMKMASGKANENGETTKRIITIVVQQTIFDCI